MNLKVVGDKANNKSYRNLYQSRERILKGISLAFKDIATAHTQQLITDLNDKGAKTGRVYQVRVRGKMITHRASAPFQTPATLTGNYEATIETKPSGGNQLIFGVGANYAAELELGGVTNAPRPGLKNTIQKEERNTRVYFETRITKELLG